MQKFVVSNFLLELMACRQKVRLREPHAIPTLKPKLLIHYTNPY